MKYMTYCSTFNLVFVKSTENIKSSLDNNRFGCGILIDLENAFDIVNHDISRGSLNIWNPRHCFALVSVTLE